MAERRPLVLISGRVKELPTADTLPGVGGGGTTISPAQITGWQNNYNPTGLASTVSRMILDTNGFHFLTGLGATAEGHVLELVNPTNFCIGLKHGSTDSTAANRFDFSDSNGKNEMDIMVYPRQTTTLIYRSSRWRHMSGGKIQDVPYQLGHWTWDEMLQRTQPAVGWGAPVNSGGTPSDLLAVNSPLESRLGVFRFSTAASSSASVTKSSFGTASFYSAASGNTDNYMVFEVIVRWPSQAADATDDWYIGNLGIANSVSGTVTRGCCLLFDRLTNGGNWRLFRRNSTVNTTTNLGSGPILNTWHKIRIVQYPNGWAEVWQDGTMIGQSTDATRILDEPSGANFYFYKVAGTGARIMDMDGIGGGQIRAKFL
jgi:hypothetical protein